MSTSTHLHFHTVISRGKPNSVHNRNTACPFCDRDSLEDILAEEGSIILLKNKFPVLEDTLMTLIIETDECDSDLSVYPKEHLYKLIRFGVKHWQEMSASGKYASVLFFKNHGPYSGGSIAHPHMQIIGLETVDYREKVLAEHFVGLLIAEGPGVTFSLSTKPRVGFFEFNVVLDDMERIDTLSDFTQIATHYVMNHFHKNCNSYNLFFYQLDAGKIAVKIVPRFVTSPIYVGFSIPQVSTDRLPEVVKEIQKRYL